MNMAREKRNPEQHGVWRRVKDYLRHHRRATRVELAVLVLLFLFFEFVVPTLLTSQSSKQFFEKHLSDAVNYPVTFDSVNTHLFGRPMMQVSGFKIRDRQGQVFFKADDATLELSAWALLRGRIELKRFHMMDGEFLAARLPDGRWNIADLVSAGNDPDHAIDLDRAAVEMKNVVVTLQDQALPLPLLQHVRLRDFSISSLDIRRHTRLRIDAIDDDQPNSSLMANGNFALFIPDDLSTLSGHLDLTLQHFDLHILNPYLRAYSSPVAGLEGSYTLEMRMDGGGAAPLPIHVQSSIENLRVALAPLRPEAPTKAPNPQTLTRATSGQVDRNLEWISLGSASLQGQVNVANREIQLDKLQGTLAQAKFDLNGRVFNLLGLSPRVEGELVTGEFELIDPLRALIRSELDSFTQTILSGVTGVVQAHLKWNGKITEPALEWTAEIKKGRYRDAQYQFDLKDVAATLHFTSKKIQIESLRAQLFNSPLLAQGWVGENRQLNLNLSVAALPLAQFYPYLRELRRVGQLNSAGWLDRLASADGPVQAKLHVVGSFEHPDITGMLNFTRTKLQLAGVNAPLDNLKGQLLLTDEAIHAQHITGTLGDSPLELDASFNSRTFSLFALSLRSPHMDLKRYDELTAARWIDPIHWPGAGRLQEADGTAALQVNYRPEALGHNPPADARNDGRHAEFSVEMHDANAVLSNVALPLRHFSGRLSYLNDGLKFEQIQGDVGNSSLSIEGAIEHLDQPGERWALKAQTHAVFPQLAKVFPAKWQSDLDAQGRIPVSLTLRGTPAEGIQVQGHVDFPPESAMVVANSLQKPESVPCTLAVSGVLKDRTFHLDDGTLVLDDVPLQIAGELHFPEHRPASLNLTISRTKFFPVTTLLKFVKLPDEDVKIQSGLISGFLNLNGEVKQLSWGSSLRVADVSITGMPWGTTSLTGDLTGGPQNLTAKDFLAIVNNVPMRLTGGLNLVGPHPALTVEVKNMNLDALIATLTRMSAVAQPSNTASSGRPLSIHVTASSGVFFHQPISRFAAEGDWRDGILKLDPMQVQAGDSTSISRVTWNSRTNEQRMELDAKQVPMKPFLDEVLNLQLPVAGKLTVVANLTSRNPDPNNLLGSFEGTAHFEASNGTLENSGLQQRLLSMAVLVHEGLFGFNFGRIFQTIDPPKFKTFKSFSADVSFLPNATARLESSEFKSDLFNLTAAGMVDTKTEDMNIAVKGSLPEIPRGSNFLAQIFGRISVRDIYRNIRDFTLLASGQRKHIKPRRYNFEFRLTGNLEGIKSIEDFHFTR